MLLVVAGLYRTLAHMLEPQGFSIGRAGLGTVLGNPTKYTIPV